MTNGSISPFCFTDNRKALLHILNLLKMFYIYKITVRIKPFCEFIQFKIRLDKTNFLPHFKQQ